MFDIAPSEFLLVAFVALVVIGPKDLPKAMRVVGYWVGKARGVARQFRSGFDEMVRESELAEMEKKWAEENARIMREHPATAVPAIEAPTTDASGTVDHGSGEPVADQADAPEPAASDAPLRAKHRNMPAPTTQPSLFEEGDARPVMVEKPVVEPAPGPSTHADTDGKAPS